LDIKNSQPLLSLVFLDEELFTKNGILERVMIYNESFKNGNENTSLAKLLYNLIRKASSFSDTLDYREKVSTGTIYEFFGEVLQEKGLVEQNIDKNQLRLQTKKQFLRSLFDTNRSIGYNRFTQTFRDCFPTVYDIFQLVKKKNHRTLACVLQNIESEIILHKASKRLSEVIPNAPLFTIHDSIASTVENKDIVKTILSEELYNALGFSVIPAEEPWDEHLIEKKRKKKMQCYIGPGPLNESDSGYGFCDYELDAIKYSNSLTQAANAFSIKRNKFIEGLRQLQILHADRNIPLKKYENEKLLIPIEFYKGSQRLFSTKVTSAGMSFLERVIAEHPTLFPKKRVYKKSNLNQ
jgi:hypothetical protein